MRRIFFFVFVLVLTSLNLTGCSTNTRTENTAVGAFLGAVAGGLAENGISNGKGHGRGVAAGIVVGALIGAIIGHWIDSSDHSSSYPAQDKKVYLKTASSQDPQTGVIYTMTAKSNVYSINGNPNCRDFHFRSTRRPKTEFDGTACFTPDGHWEQIRKPA